MKFLSLLHVFLFFLIKLYLFKIVKGFYRFHGIILIKNILNYKCNKDYNIYYIFIKNKYKL